MNKQQISRENIDDFIRSLEIEMAREQRDASMQAWQQSRRAHRRDRLVGNLLLLASAAAMAAFVWMCLKWF